MARVQWENILGAPGPNGREMRPGEVYPDGSLTIEAAKQHIPYELIVDKVPIDTFIPINSGVTSYLDAGWMKSTANSPRSPSDYLHDIRGEAHNKNKFFALSHCGHIYLLHVAGSCKCKAGSASSCPAKAYIYDSLSNTLDEHAGKGYMLMFGCDVPGQPSCAFEQLKLYLQWRITEHYGITEVPDNAYEAMKRLVITFQELSPPGALPSYLVPPKSNAKVRLTYAEVVRAAPASPTIHVPGPPTCGPASQSTASPPGGVTKVAATLGGEQAHPSPLTSPIKLSPRNVHLNRSKACKIVLNAPQAALHPSNHAVVTALCGEAALPEGGARSMMQDIHASDNDDNFYNVFRIIDSENKSLRLHAVVLKKGDNYDVLQRRAAATITTAFNIQPIADGTQRPVHVELDPCLHPPENSTDLGVQHLRNTLLEADRSHQPLSIKMYLQCLRCKKGNHQDDRGRAVQPVDQFCDPSSVKKALHIKKHCKTCLSKRINHEDLTPSKRLCKSCNNTSDPACFEADGRTFKTCHGCREKRWSQPHSKEVLEEGAACHEEGAACLKAHGTADASHAEPRAEFLCTSNADLEVWCQQNLTNGDYIYVKHDVQAGGQVNKKDPDYQSRDSTTWKPRARGKARANAYFTRTRYQCICHGKSLFPAPCEDECNHQAPTQSDFIMKGKALEAKRANHKPRNRAVLEGTYKNGCECNIWIYTYMDPDTTAKHFKVVTTGAHKPSCKEAAVKAPVNLDPKVREWMWNLLDAGIPEDKVLLYSRKPRDIPPGNSIIAPCPNCGNLISTHPLGSTFVLCSVKDI
jgi:hypothetical protein